MNVAQILSTATTKLKAADITTARLDAQLLVGDELDHDKSWLLAHPDAALTDLQVTHIQEKLTRRVAHEPMAYIRGKQEFYGREFMLNSQVLIPRPESEALIEELAKLQPAGVLVDVGTGSGCLAITAALEWPELEVCGLDISSEALEIAHQNAQKLGAKVQFEQHDLLANFTQSAHFIVANLPYVAPTWKRSKETNYEPSLALFAEDEGMALIKRLISQAASLLENDGYLLLEADPRQHQAISQCAKEQGFLLVQTRGFSLVFQRKQTKDS